MNYNDQEDYNRTQRFDPPPNNKKNNQSSKLKTIALVIVGALLGSAISLSVAYLYLPEIIEGRGPIVGDRAPIVLEPQHDITVYSAVAEKAMPSVVGITTVTTQVDRFWGPRRAEGLGTGVIVDERGYILTNAHVVGDGAADEVGVLLYNGDRLTAEILWYDNTLDLAVIKVEEEGLTAAELGDSDHLTVGEIAVAIGNPLGLNFERTLTQGVISGLNRSIPISQTQTIDNLIQTDASINPGNSGGPLLNAKGQVIGINTAKIGTGEGLGFAVPINTAKPIVDQFIEKGEFTRVYLGIRGLNVEEFEAATGERLQAQSGVYIFEIIAASVADQYDLRTGDVIIGINNTEIESMGGLIRELYRYRPGDEIDVTVLRNGGEEIISLTFNEDSTS
ncbi:trypsin-like peptidase domain-containing protein [Serpentinicella sp. ANB-PHB4]|uniref:serine protease HtrA n=1 Tax=Serpentinicella sp. ANB-PHB4 TaxID=3074076 RepID=UPI0028567998|nr:trypsin-like peptidase domain-containing protein [Serpentinicella sp. ANB-PHB4]MDR5658868.1 trypsin-like peptidase domain-containing protein [Serpentinicella sp. ANB-PHB4]